MNKLITPIILVTLALGIYFTFTDDSIEKAKAIRAINDEYKNALSNANELLSQRDNLNQVYSGITQEDKEKLNKIIPSNIDNVRLIIDIQDIALKNGLSLRDLTTSATANSNQSGSNQGGQNFDTLSTGSDSYNVVDVSFGVTTSYQGFINLLKSLEKSLRILEVTDISLSPGENGLYNYSVNLKTYWLKI